MMLLFGNCPPLSLRVDGGKGYARCLQRDLGYPIRQVFPSPEHLRHGWHAAVMLLLIRGTYPPDLRMYVI